LRALGVGELEDGIQRGIDPARIHFGDNGLTGAALETEDIPVAGSIDAAVHGDGKLDALRGGGGVVGLFLEGFGKGVHHERRRGGERMSGVYGRLVRGRFQPVSWTVVFGAGAAAQRESAGHKRQLSDGYAIHEILAPAVDGIADLDGVLAVLGDGIVDDGVGMEAVVVVIRQLISAGVVERQNGLNQPGTASARYGINSRALAAITSSWPLRAWNRYRSASPG